ncbi:PKD domain-containing protein, partial [Rhodopirellula baltica]|uniref:PKD domain-containing protein n=1 Tax=Rhodopirellula baltica TaxID=265606 RepID=UPI001F30F8E4
VEGPDSVNQWTITGENTGNINNGQYSFANVGRLDGGPQEDVFTIESDGSYDGFFIGNGGTDRLELAARSQPLEVSVNSRSVPGVLGSYSLEKVVALAPADNQLLGSEANTNWQVTADGDIRVNSVTYTGFDSILGGSGDDTLLVDYTGGNLEAALQIAFDGGSGGNDGLGFTGGSFQTVSYDPAQGTLQLNDVTFELATGNLINLTNSSIANLLVDIDQTNLVANEITTTFTAADTTDTLISFSESLGGLLVRNVSGRLTVLGDIIDSDTVTLAGIGSSLAANVAIDGGGGTDQVAFDETFVLKNNDDLDVLAEQITINAGVSVQTQGTGRVTLKVDDLNVDLTSTIQSADSVVLAPLSADRDIGVGTENTGELSLPIGLLNRITSPSLVIGNEEINGDITLSGDVTLATNTDLQFITSGDIFLAGTIDTAGGKLWLNPGAAPHAVHVGLTSNEVIASELSFAPNRDIRFTIDGTTPNTEYSQLSLLGSLDLTGVNLVIDGEYSVGLAESFVLIENDGMEAVLGTFKGLPESSFIDNFLGSSLSAQITYLGSDAATGNDVVLTVTTPPNVPPVADAGGPYEVNEGGAVQLNALNSRDPDASDETLVFHWDLDGDGVFGETGVGAERGDELGSNPDFDANHLNGPTSVTVAMRAIDLSGDSDTAYATVNVRNVAPTISLDTSIAVGRGETWTIDGSFVDPGPDTWTGTINYADGSGDQLLVLDGNEFELSHAYGAAGVYTAIVTIDDGEGGVTSENLIVDVDLTPLADLTLISSDVLFDPINPDVGESFDFVVGVTNAGTLAASDVPASIQVYDALTESFLEIGRGLLPSIDADPEGDAKSEAQVRLTWDGNNGQPALPTEEAYLLVRVVLDPDSTIEELDESNNEAIQVLQVGSPDFGSAELVADIPDRTFYRDQYVAVGGQAFYDFSTIPGTNDFPIQNASVTARLFDSSGNVLAASGARTAPNGNFLHTMRSPKEDGDYTLRFEISDGTFSRVFESTLTVDGESPDPPPQRPRGPAGPGYVFSSSVEITDPVLPENPQIGEEATILGSFNFELDQLLLKVPVTFNDLFPVAGQVRTFEIGSGSISFPEGGLAGPALLSMGWTPTAEGYHIIQVIAKPEFEFKAHTHTTRLVLVGDLDTTSLNVEYNTTIVPDSELVSLMSASRGFATAFAAPSMRAMAVSETPEPGDTLSFTLRYENTGTTTITGGVLMDDFDESLMGMPTNISDGGTADGNVIRWELGDIAPGAFGTVTYEVTINSSAEFPPGSAYLFNTAVLNADQAVAASTSELTVNNNAPVISSINVEPIIDANGDVTLTGTFSDASTVDTHTINVSWGDNQTDTLIFTAGQREFRIGHSYALNSSPPKDGIYAINVSVSDDSSQTSNSGVTTQLPAVALADSFEVDQATTLSVEIADSVLSNDIGATSDPLQAVLATAPENAESFTLRPDGTFTYTPLEDFRGTDEFSYYAENSAGKSQTAIVQIVVRNLAPTIESIELAGRDDQSVAGEVVRISGTFLDAGTSLIHFGTVDWGDGSGPRPLKISIDSNSKTFEATHIYATPGSYPVEITIDDGDLHTTTSLTAEIQSAEPTTGVRLVDGVLHIIGTDQNDLVNVSRLGSRVYVYANFLPSTHRLQLGSTWFPLADVLSIQAKMRDGNDIFRASAWVTVPATIDGGSGNDVLTAGGGSSLLLGGEGNDFLLGGQARNVLIGGGGRDHLLGGRDEDLLIGGDFHAIDENPSGHSLQDQVMSVWNGDDPYNTRIEAIDGLIDDIDDGERDMLFGLSGRDLYFNGLGDRAIGVRRAGSQAETIL